MFPFIRKEGEYFIIGSKEYQDNEIYLSKLEIKILKNKLNEIDIDKFFWKHIEYMKIMFYKIRRNIYENTPDNYNPS